MIGGRWYVASVGSKRPNIMIIIHLPDIKKGKIILARGDLFDDRFQSLICRNKVYKVAKNSNINHALPNVFALVSGLLKRLLES